MLTADARALLQTEAFVARAAVSATGRRHVRVSDRPLVVVPMVMAGEDGALLAAGIGHDPRRMELIFCPEPRNRDLADETTGAFAQRLCDWLDPLQEDRERVEVYPGHFRELLCEPPQLVVPTPAGATLLRRLGERMTWRQRDPVSPVVTRAGGWLWYFCDRHELVAGDSALLVTTEALLQHWVPPISDAEASHLLALEAALAPPRGESALVAAREAELLPGSTLTSPSFDRDRLAPAIRLFNEARRNDAPARKLASLRGAIGKLLRPVVSDLYDACHAGLRRLRALEAIEPVHTRRLLAERVAATRHADYIERGGRFRRADAMRRGLMLLDDAEVELARVTAEARWHDPVIRAVASLSGETLEGELRKIEVVSVQGPKRIVQRLELQVSVPGAWRPVGDDGFELVWDPDGFAFSVRDLRAARGSTLVTLRSTDKVRAVIEEVAPEVQRGDRVAFVQRDKEFPRVPVPTSVPWMLNPNEAPPAAEEA